MFEVQILVPLSDNDGVQFSQDVHVTFEAFILHRFGGLSRYDAGVDGLWVDAGRTYRDRNVVYGVALKSITEGSKLAEVVTFAKKLYRQEAIFLRFLGLAEIL